MQESVTAMESAAKSQGSGGMHTAVRKWEGGEAHAYFAREQHDARGLDLEGHLSDERAGPAPSSGSARITYRKALDLRCIRLRQPLRP